MGRPGEAKYVCPECDGEGVTNCPACGALETCFLCRGSTFNPDKVDISAFRVAEKALALRRANNPGPLDPETDERWVRVKVTDYLLDQ